MPQTGSGSFTSTHYPSAREGAQWAVGPRAASLGFFLSRPYGWTFPREGDGVHVKDPDADRRILPLHRDNAPPAI